MSSTNCSLSGVEKAESDHSASNSAGLISGAEETRPTVRLDEMALRGRGVGAEEVEHALPPPLADVVVCARLVLVSQTGDAQTRFSP